MKSLKSVLTIIVFVALLIGLYAYRQYKEKPGNNLIDTLVYECDNGRTITAAYYKGGEMPKVSPGEPPKPTGSVEISLDKGASTTLKQTISGSGIRYANADESLVFWSKGEEALIMRNNKMDLSYLNCKALK